MTARKRSRNAPCACGSGKKYKQCCWSKGFSWVEDEQGRVGRQVSLPAEAVEMLEAWREQFRQRFGREPGPDEALFLEAPPLEQAEHQIAQAMKQAGIDPALIHAFEQTGLLVAQDNQHLIPEQDLRAWEAAVSDYRARQGPHG